MPTDANTGTIKTQSMVETPSLMTSSRPSPSPTRPPVRVGLARRAAAAPSPPRTSTTSALFTSGGKPRTRQDAHGHRPLAISTATALPTWWSRKFQIEEPQRPDQSRQQAPPRSGEYQHRHRRSAGIRSRRFRYGDGNLDAVVTHPAAFKTPSSRGMALASSRLRPPRRRPSSIPTLWPWVT